VELPGVEPRTTRGLTHCHYSPAASRCCPGSGEKRDRQGATESLLASLFRQWAPLQRVASAHGHRRPGEGHLEVELSGGHGGFYLFQPLPEDSKPVIFQGRGLRRSRQRFVGRYPHLRSRRYRLRTGGLSMGDQGERLLSVPPRHLLRTKAPKGPIQIFSFSVCSSRRSRWRGGRRRRGLRCGSRP